MSASQQVTGLASGMDTASIVEQLMKIEKIPYEKLDIKKQTQQLKLQAYQAVNSMLLKFRTSVSTLSSQKLWKSKTASSTNDKSLTATAGELAVNGSYSFKVAQLATATQFMTKGFADKKTSFVKQAVDEEPYKIGSISMNSAKSRVDTSAKLEVLNGGQGIYRGSVRITDGANNTSIIDLSGCDTMDDVVRSLNESTGAQITASIRDGSLYIADESKGSGDMKIQNVGSGSTATDLGIAGTAQNGVVHGRNVFTMGTETGVTMLNDGLGIEEGFMNLRVSDSSGYIDILVNVDDCNTVGDIVNRVNQEIEYRRANNTIDPNGGGSGAALLDGLRFGLNDSKTGFALTNTKENHSYRFSNYQETGKAARQLPATSLGLDGDAQISTGDGTSIDFKRVLGDVNSPMLKNLSGVHGYGIGAASETPRIPTALDTNTKVSWLNNGRGVDISRPLSIQLKEGGEDGSGGVGLSRVFDDIIDMNDLRTFIDTDPTVGQMLHFLNDKLADYAADPANQAAGLTGMFFGIDTSTQRLVVMGAQGGYKVEIGGTMMADLGLTRLDNNGTAIEIDPTYYGQADYDARKAAIDEFYELNSFADPTHAMMDNDTIVVDGDPGELTTLRDLAKLHNVDPTDDAAVAAWFQSTFGQGDPLNPNYLDVKVTHHAYDNSNPPVFIEDRVYTARVDLSGFNADSTVKDILDHVNSSIQTQFDAVAGANPGWDQISAPQLRVHTLGDRLQWSNMDFTKDFEASGNVADTFYLDRNITSSTVDTQHPDVVAYNYSPMRPGYLEKMDVNPANGDTVQLGHLRGGAMLTFAGDDSDTIDIDLGAGKTISIRKDELVTAIGGSLNTTLNQYVAALNTLVDQKLTALNAGLGLTDPADQVDFEFKLGDGQLEITGVKNADYLKVSGDMADVDKTAIGPVDIATVEDGKSYGVGTLSAYQLKSYDLVGLGTIHMELGGIAAELSTEGLTGDSTLQDLIDKLNDQLQNYGDTSHTDFKNEAFKDVRFTINDAGTGIAVNNSSNQALKFIHKESDTIASDLGLVDAEGKGVEVESFSHHNSTSLGRKYVSRATLLSNYAGSNGELGTIQITNAGGVSWTADLSGCKTVGDLIDFINQEEEFGVRIALNEFGDGLTFFEYYSPNSPPAFTPTGNISIADLDGGSIAKALGIAGTGSRDVEGWGTTSVFEGSQKTTIDVMSTDNLESLMYRIAEKGGYKTAIINDGSATNPYRLTIASDKTGEASDFVIESDMEMFGFNQTSRGKDSKVLYGDPNSSASPIMLSSSTNSNSNAILGLTLDLKSVTSEYVTINVDTDKEKVTEEFKNLVQTYNDLNSMISLLDAYDEETGEPGVLFGDPAVRQLIEGINDMFYLVFNPNQTKVGSTNKDGVLNTWTWMDIGINLTAKNSNADGSGNWYSTMELDEEALAEMVAKNWDTLYSMMAGQRNASDSTLEEAVKATSSFSGTAAEGFKPDNAINGDSNRGSWGINNGFMADGTIKDGENEYTIFFQKPTTISRMSIYHMDSDTALKNFTVEYLDANTGKWETLRDIKNNSVDANHLGLALPTEVSAVRIKATSTNAEDDKFRLLDVQIFEDIGLAGQLNQHTSQLGDSQLGFLKERSDEINSTLSDIEEQMLRLQERLELKEENLWKRFTAMETALGQLQNQSSYFTSMMDSLGSSKK